MRTFHYLLLLALVSIGLPAWLRAGEPPARSTLTPEQVRAKVSEYLTEATRSADAIDYAEYRMDAFTRIAETCLQAGDVKTGYIAYGQAVETARHSSHPGQDVWVTIDFVSALGKTGHPDEARKLLDAIADPKERERAYKEFAAAQAVSGDDAGARKTIDGLKDEQLKQEGWLMLSMAQARAGNRDAALLSAKNITDAHLKDRSARAIGAALAKAKDTDAAIKSVERIVDPLIRLKALLQIAKIETAAGDKAAARATLVQARLVADARETIQEKIMGYCDIAIALAQNGDADASKEIFAVAMQMQQTLKPQSSPLGGPPHLYNPLPYALAQAGDVTGAMRQAGADESYVGNVASGQARVGDITGAQKTAALVHDNIYKNNAMLDIAQAQVKAGDFAGARQTTAALDASDAQIQMQSNRFRDMASIQAKAGELSAVEAWADSLRGSPPLRAQILVGAAQAILPPMPADLPYEFE